MTITRTWKITLYNEFKLTTKDVQLKTMRQSETRHIQVHIPKFNLIKIDNVEQGINNVKPIQLGVLMQPVIKDPTELVKLSLSLDEIEKDLEDNEKISIQVKRYYPVGSAITIVLIGDIVGITIQLIKRKKIVKYLASTTPSVVS